MPNSMMEESKQIIIADNQSSCPNDLTAFTTVPCAYASLLGDGHPISIEKAHCLNAKDVIKLNKCGDGWAAIITNGSNCICSEVGILLFAKDAILGIQLLVSMQINSIC